MKLKEMTTADETLDTLVREAIRICTVLQLLSSSAKHSPERMVAIDYIAEIKDRLSKLRIILETEDSKTDERLEDKISFRPMEC